MNIIQRARFLMFRDVPKAKPKATAAAKVENPLARSILFGLGKQAFWSTVDYKTLAKEGYEKCMAVYACVSLIARTAAGIEFKVERDGAEIEKHPILDLLRRPNNEEGKRAFITKRFSYLLLSGNSFIQAGRAGSAFAPGALFQPAPYRMLPIPGTNGQLIDGWEYRAETGAAPITLEKSSILHSRLFHPTDDFFGLSPLAVAARGIDVSNMAAEWNMRLIQNDMRPSGVLSTEQMLTIDQRAKLQEVISDHSGPENTAFPLVLESGLKWQQIGINPKDMDWLESSAFTKRELASIFNIAPELIGDAQNKTYSNFQEARKGLYTEAVLPLMEEFVDELNGWLCPMYPDNPSLKVDRDKIEALQEDRAAKFAYISNADFLRVNEKRKATGFDPVEKTKSKPGDVGEMILISAGKVPLENIGVEPDPPAPAAGKTPEEIAAEAADAGRPAAGKSETMALWGTPERKRALWDSFKARVETKEKGAIGLARQFLLDQADRIKGKIVKNVNADHLIDVEKEAREFHSVMLPWAIHAAISAGNAGMQSAKGEIPDLESKANLFTLTGIQKRKLDQMVLNSGTKIAKTTMAFVRDQLKIAEIENQTVEDLTQTLIGKLDEMALWKCRQIARTETAKVENWGTDEGYKQSEFVTGKGWICSFVPDSRESHIEADGQEVGIDEPFQVALRDGGTVAMDYPGDPAGEAENVVNCLCSTYPIVSAA